MSHHTHRANESLSRTIPWTHCVAGPHADCSGASHGGVTHVDRCNCGATRRVESNGRHVTRGPWEAPSLTERLEVEVAGRRYYVQEDCEVLAWDEVAGHYSRCVTLSTTERQAAVRAAVGEEVSRLLRRR